MSYQNVVLEGIAFEEGALNTSGIQEQAYFIPKSYIATLQDVAPGATTASLIEITGNHVLKAGKAPIPIETLFDKSGMDSAMTGEKFSRIFMANPKFFMPQPTSANAANFAVMGNMRGIVLIKRAIGGDWIQIGGAGLYATVKDGSVKFGDGPTGTPGVEFGMEAPSIMPFYVYKGELPAPAAGGN